MRTIRTPENRDAFLDALGETASVTAACKIAGIARNAAYDWRGEDEAFCADWETALDRGTDALEDEAVRRARRGVDKPVFYQGRECAIVREYSDTLLIFMLKARRPERFRERTTTELTGPRGGPVALDIRTATTDQLIAALAALDAPGGADDQAGAVAPPREG